MKKAALILSVIAVAWWATTLPRSESLVTLRGETMGTTYQVHIAGTVTDAQPWRDKVQQCLDDVNARMSTYRADSEVSRFNRTDSTDWFPVSADTAQVVGAALQVSEQTGGAFDITVGPLVNLWSFGPDFRPSGIPSPEAIEAARANVGFQWLSVRLDPPALRKQVASLHIDLSAIAKGFAVDAVGQLLEEAGFDGYMVEVGGEVLARGTKADGQPWRIGVEQPVVGERRLHSVVALADRSLATSGDYRNVFQWEGELYSHEIDPRTGWPVRHGVAAVSVLSDSAMWADAYATGLLIMPPEEAWRLANKLELEIMLVEREAGQFSRRISDGFARSMVETID